MVWSVNSRAKDERLCTVRPESPRAGGSWGRGRPVTPDRGSGERCKLSQQSSQWCPCCCRVFLHFRSPDNSPGIFFSINKCWPIGGGRLPPPYLDPSMWCFDHDVLLHGRGRYIFIPSLVGEAGYSTDYRPVPYMSVRMCATTLQGSIIYIPNKLAHKDARQSIVLISSLMTNKDCQNIPSGVIFSSEMPFLRLRNSPRRAPARLAGSGGGLLVVSSADLQLKLPPVSTPSHTYISALAQSTTHHHKGVGRFHNF